MGRAPPCPSIPEDTMLSWLPDGAAEVSNWFQALSQGPRALSQDGLSSVVVSHPWEPFNPLTAQREP